MASKDVMIDIETMALSSDALVLSIGAVEFDCVGKDGPWFGEDFLIVPDLVEQIALGRAVDRGTQKFWQEQPDEASLHWREPLTKSTVRHALVGLGAFVADAPRIWANGIVFDIGILENLYRQCGLAIPWKYNAARDARTFYDTNDHQRVYEAPAGEPCAYVAHHPIADCKIQIIRLWEHRWSQ